MTPVSNKEISIAKSVIHYARAFCRAGRPAIGLSAPPKNTRIQLNLASLSPMDATNSTCFTEIWRVGCL